MMDAEKFQKVEVSSTEALETWLAARHSQTESAWLVTFKKTSPDKHVSRDAVLDALIAWGWIDGRRMKLDDARTMQLISPRKLQPWARSYQERAARLEAEGRLRAPGRAVIDAAKSAGLWDATADVDALVTPDDLAEALGDQIDAARYFASAAPSYRRNVLRWLAAAKRADTRAKRVAAIAAACGAGEKIKHF